MKNENVVVERDVGVLLTGENAKAFISLFKDSTESAKQYYFERCTGIWCIKPARDRLEALLESGEFTGQQLGRAWRHGALGWNRDAGDFVYRWDLNDVLLGYVTPMAVFLLWLLSSFYLFQAGWNWVVPVFGLGSFFLLVCACSSIFVLEPRRIARKIRAFEAKRK